MSNERSVGGAARALAEAAAAVAHAPDLDAALGRILSAAMTAVEANTGAIFLQDPDLASLQLVAASGLDETSSAALGGVLVDSSDPASAVLRERTIARFSEDPTRPDTGAPVVESRLLHGIGQATAALRPLVVSREAIEAALGVLVVAWTAPRDVDSTEVSVLGTVADLAAAAVDRARLASLVTERSEWFERMAHADPLTGLANSRTFARILELEIARAGRQGGEVSLAIFDIDSFSATNQAAGHDVGDDILRMVAAVLAESVRLVDTVARYGGDEFVLVAPGSAGMTVAQRVLEGIARLAPVEGRRVTISAGVARFPADGASAEELIAAAESALRTARDAGPGGLAEASVVAG